MVSFRVLAGDAIITGFVIIRVTSLSTADGGMGHGGAGGSRCSEHWIAPPPVSGRYPQTT
jgi:hypothetical protein